MAQIKQGLARFESGSATVYLLWDLVMDDNVSAWAVGDDLTWPGGGVGKVALTTASDNDRLVLYKTAGDDPEVSDNITNTTQVDNASVTTIQARPDWVAELTPYASEFVEVVAVGPMIPAVWDGTIGNVTSSKLELSSAWPAGNGTLEAAEYGIHTDYTDEGLPIFTDGDRAVPQLLNRALSEISRRLRWNGARIEMDTDAESWAGSTWVRPTLDTTVEDVGGVWVQAASGGGQEFVIPSGVNRINLNASIGGDGVDGNNILSIRVLHNGSAIDPGPGTSSEYRDPVTAVIMGMSVTPGDTIQIEGQQDAGAGKTFDQATTYAVIHAVGYTSR